MAKSDDESFDLDVPKMVEPVEDSLDLTPPVDPEDNFSSDLDDLDDFQTKSEAAGPMEDSADLTPPGASTNADASANVIEVREEVDRTETEPELRPPKPTGGVRISRSWLVGGGIVSSLIIGVVSLVLQFTGGDDQPTRTPIPPSPPQRVVVDPVDELLELVEGLDPSELANSVDSIEELAGLVEDGLMTASQLERAISWARGVKTDDQTLHSTLLRIVMAGEYVVRPTNFESNSSAIEPTTSNFDPKENGVASSNELASTGFGAVSPQVLLLLPLIFGATPDDQPPPAGMTSEDQQRWDVQCKVFQDQTRNTVARVGAAFQLAKLGRQYNQWERAMQLCNDAMELVIRRTETLEPLQLESLEKAVNRLRDLRQDLEFDIAKKAFQETVNDLTTQITNLINNPRKGDKGDPGPPGRQGPPGPPGAAGTAVPRNLVQQINRLQQELGNIPGAMSDLRNDMVTVKKALSEIQMQLNGGGTGSEPPDQTLLAGPTGPALFGRGYHAFFSRDPEECKKALPLFAEAARSEPRNPIYRYYLALALRQRGKLDDAIAQAKSGRHLEARYPGFVSHSLERIQGSTRMWLEDIRLGFVR